MAVRLVIGRAGTGKTALCVEEIRAAAARDPLGPPLLWITPEQATFSAERLLLTSSSGASQARGNFRTQVLSFRRLALLIARETGILPAGAQAARPMDEVARIVLLEETVRQQRGQLSVFAGSADRPGFIQKLDATLRELRQQGHSGGTLRQLIEAGGARMDVVMQRKLQDLAVLLDAWSQVMDRPEAWDFESLMHRAILAMKKAPMIVGGPSPTAAGAARVWVDAISAMSSLEMRMVAELGLWARDVTVTLLADPAAAAVRDLRASADAAGDTELFARTHRLHRRLLDTFRRHGVTMAPTLALRQARRFDDPQLQRIEQAMFDETAPVAAVVREPVMPVATGRVPAALRGRKRGGQQPSLFDVLEGVAPVANGALPTAPEATPVPRMGGVEVWECSDPETEVRIVAQAVRQLVTGLTGQAPLRYRQIGVIVPELDDGGTGSGYQDAIRRIFAEHAIPHFVDARRSIAHHPLVELLRTAVALVRTHFDRDEMLLLLKTQLLGVAQEDVALLENYLLEHGIDHVPWDRPWTWVAPNQEEGGRDDRLPQSAFLRLDRVNKIRQRVWGMLEGFVVQMTQPPGEGEAASGARFAEALRAFLKTLGVEGQLEKWIAAARVSSQPGSAELAQVHQQVWREVDRLLLLLETVLAGRQRTLAEFERLVSTALQSLTLGLIPPTVDQVLVSSVTRSRVPEMEIVFILGAVEGHFPKVVPEDPILSDAQRAVFNEIAADPIGEGSDRQLLEMPFFDYVALTRARRHVVISCPLADRAGKALGCSRHVQRLRELLGEALIQRNFDAQSRTHIDRIATVDDLLAGVARRARGAYTQAVGRTAERAQEDDALMPAVYNWLVSRAPAGIDAARRQIWAGIGPRPVLRLAPELAARFFPAGSPVRLSISQLEQFAACPLQFFAHDTLGLRDRPVFQLDELSLGELQHRVLERVYRRLMDGALPWPETTQAKTRELLIREIDGTIEELHAELAQRTPGYDKLRLRLIRVLGIVLESDRRRAMAGQLRPRAVELYFGRDTQPRHDKAGRLISLPVLNIAGRNAAIHISGKIDRMDQILSGTEAAVIDYKSASYKSLDLFRVLHGISLQLPAYALVLRDLALRTPIAAFYLALGLKTQTIQHAGEARDPASDEFFQQFRPRGLADADHAWQLDGTLPAPGDPSGGKSAWYRFSFTQKGPPAKNSDLLTHEDFLLLLTFVRGKIRDLGSDLAEGVIAPAPYRCGTDAPCNYCDFASLCPMDQARDPFREVAKEKPAIVLDKMRRATA